MKYSNNISKPWKIWWMWCLWIYFSTLPLIAATQLPQLNWSQRNWPGKSSSAPFSDWVNVKTDVVPAAVGDGIADDTAALQAALDKIDSEMGGLKVVYLPPGTYKISNTLHLIRQWGTGIIGHGRDTTIVWAGPVGGRMFWSDGATCHRFIGIVWDGQGTAAVGIDHDSHGNYETRILHRHEEFRGFTDAGVRVGHSQGGAVATAETQYYNCLFKNNYAGIKLLWANDYNHLIQGCDFLDNTHGVYAGGLTYSDSGQGNYNLYNCHFERSATADIWAPSHPSSIRRCTSIGSYRFVYGPIFRWKNAHAIQDCHVSGWMATDGAIYWGSGGPLTLFDCSFTNGPNNEPPVQFFSPSSSILRVVASNNKYMNASSLTKKAYSAVVQETWIKGRTRGSVLDNATQSFFSNVDFWTVPSGIIYDAKVHFGAVGDGVVDDTVAIQRCINAAKNAGNGAVAYVPSGYYKVTSTLTAPRGTYRISGSGFRSGLLWYGSASGGPVLLIDDPIDLTVEGLLVENRAGGNVQQIRQISSNGYNSRVRYDYLFFSYGATERYNGIELLGLPSGATVLMDNVGGHLNIIDSSRATIVCNALIGERVKVSNPSRYAKSGYAGIAFLGAVGIDVMDNQDLIVGDVYTESAQYFLRASGNGNTNATGRITITGGGRINTIEPYNAGRIVTLNDYQGRIFLGNNPCDPISSDFTQWIVPNFNHTGISVCDLTVMGMSFNQLPVFNLGAACRKIVYANSGLIDNSVELTIPETIPADGFIPTAAALDDLSQLGAYHTSGMWLPTGAPTNLTAMAISNSTIRLTWTDNSINEDCFMIEQSTDGVSFTPLVEAAKNQTTFDFVVPNAGVRYWFRARAFNLAGKSGFTNIADAATIATMFNIQGIVTLLGFTGDVSQVPVTVEIQQNGSVVRTELVSLSATGNYTLVNIPSGIYTLAFKANHWLGKLVTDVQVVNQDVLNVDVSLINGDANNDNQIDVGDLGILAANYGLMEGATGEQGDFNGDGMVDVGDLGILAAYYGMSGNGTAMDEALAIDANAMGTIVEDEAPAETATKANPPACSALGLPLIAGLFVLGLSLMGSSKIKEWY